MRTSHLPGSPLGRRGFLVGLAATGVVAACGGDDDTVDTADDPDGSDSVDLVDDSGDVTIFKTYGRLVFAAGAPLRAPFSLGDAIAPLGFDTSPATASVRVVGPAGSAVDETRQVTRRGEGLPRPYYTLEFTPDIAGFYNYQVDAGDLGIRTAQVEVNEPDAVTLLGPGDLMPALLTPTVEDDRGLESICTRDPQCDLHDITVADALGEPFVLLISTPAFCQIGVCGPILDLLLDQGADGRRFVHAEPFVGPPTQAGPAATPDYIGELGLGFEPAAYAVDADGVIVQRLDFVFDSDELAGLVDSVF